MPEVLTLREYTCPTCRTGSRLDARFVQWCAACGHNADPAPPKLNERGRRRAAREYQNSKRLYDSLQAAQNLRPTSVTGVCVTLLSGVVHLISLAVLVLPILLVLGTRGAVWSYVVLGLCALAFLAVRPRLPQRYLDPRKNLDRARAPKFYELLDRCAAELGCQVPAQLRFDLRFNAATGRSGLRQRSYLILGMPLWTVLSGQERIALLGHELAHQINGDTTHGLWAASARRSLQEWTKLLDPRQSAAEIASNRRMLRNPRGAIGALLAPLIMAIAFAPFFLLALGCRVLLTRLDLYCGQRAEYLADELSARLAGSEAARDLLGKVALSETVTGFLTTAKNRQGSRTPEAAQRLWPSVVQYVDSVPETEKQRRRIVDRLRNTRTDRSHPANYLRAALIATRPPLPGVLTLSADEWAAIDAELAPAYLAAARRRLGG